MREYCEISVQSTYTCSNIALQDREDSGWWCGVVVGQAGVNVFLRFVKRIGVERCVGRSVGGFAIVRLLLVSNCIWKIINLYWTLKSVINRFYSRLKLTILFFFESSLNCMFVRRNEALSISTVWFKTNSFI